MAEIRTLSVYIDRPWAQVYETVWKPEVFPKWAAGMAQSHLTKEGDHWRADGPEGPVKIRFTPHNPSGVMDHYVDTGKGVVYVPLRIIENTPGAEVVLTLIRLPDMSDQKFAADAEAIKKDLQALKKLVTS